MLRSRIMAKLLVVVAAMFGYGGSCGGPQGLPLVEGCLDRAPPSDGQETMILGTSGEGPFTVLEPRSLLKMEAGPQGGQHVYVSIDLYATSETAWEYELRLEADGELVGDRVYAAETCAPGWTRTENIRLFIFDPSRLEGLLTVEAFAVQDGARVRSIETSLRVRLEPP